MVGGLLLEITREVGAARARQPARVLNPFLDLVVPDVAQSLVERLGRLLLLGTGVGRHLVDLPLQVGDLLEHLVLALDEPAHALRGDLVGAGDVDRFPGDLQLLLDQLFAPPQRVLRVALHPPGLVALQEPPRGAQPVQRGTRVGGTLVSSSRGRLPHRVGGVLKLARRLGQTLVGLHARQLLEAPRLLLHLVGERALVLRAAPGGSLRTVGEALSSLGLLFLAPGQLAQALQRLVDLLVRLLAFAALHALVLVLELVQLQLEEVGEVLRARAAAPAPSSSTALLLAYLHLVVERLRAQEILQRLLLLGESAPRIGGVQPVHGGLHLLHRPRKQFGDLLELGIPHHAPVVEARDESRHLVAKPFLRQPHHDQALVEALRRIARAVPVQIEGRRNDLPLLLRELLLVARARASAASPSAGLLLRLAEIGLEAPDLEEVDVADRLLAAGARVVPRLGVVGDDVAGDKLVFLEEERVSRAHLAHWRRARAEQLDGLLLPAVDREDELHLPDAVVVVRARLHEELLQRVGALVAARAGEGKSRRLVVQHVDGVLGRGGDEPGARTLHLDAVEAVPLHHEGAREGAVLRRSQLARQRVVAPQVGPRAGNRGEGAQMHAGAAQHRDVAALVDGPIRQTGVGRELVHQLEPVHVRQDLDIDAVQIGLHAGGAHEVLGDVVHAEEHDFELGGVVLAGLVRREHGQGTELALGARAQEKIRLGGVEAQVAGGDALVRAARDGDVPRGHLDGVRVDLRGAGGGREQDRGSVAQERRAGQEDDEGGETDPRDRGGPAEERRPLDAVSAIHGARLLDRGLHESPDQRRGLRRPLGPGIGSGVDRAQDGGLEGWFVLLQVERDLRVGGPPPERANQAPEPHREKRHPGEDPEAVDHGGAEAASLHSPGGHQERDQSDPEQRRQPAQRDSHAPAASHMADGVEQLQSGAVVELCGHLSSPFSGATNCWPPVRPPTAGWRLFATSNWRRPSPEPGGGRPPPGDTTRILGAVPCPPARVRPRCRRPRGRFRR